MNIILIILSNIILIFALKYSVKLVIFLFILLSLWMLKLYYDTNNLLEGYENFGYRDNFWDMLNKDIKVNRESEILYNTILGKFTKIAKLMDEESGIAPPNQMCVGELGGWSPCSKECGRGKKERRFNALQKAGETGIKCIYEDGQIESKECFNRLCNYNDACEDNSDCISNYCDQLEKKCSYHNICSRAKLHNCNKGQCDELNRKYGEYTYNLDLQRCENVAVNVRFNRVDIDEGSIDKFGDLKAELERQQQKLKEQLEQTDKETLCGKTYGMQLTGKQTCDGVGLNNCDKYFKYTEGAKKYYPCFWKDDSCASDEEKYFCEIDGTARNLPEPADLKCCQNGQSVEPETPNLCADGGTTHINAGPNVCKTVPGAPTPPAPHEEEGGGSDDQELPVTPAPIAVAAACTGTWGACSEACGGGTQERNYTVASPARHGGAACPSPESRACNAEACPTDCAEYLLPESSCYACGVERYTRTAEPTNGGAACLGSSTLCKHGDGTAHCPPFNFSEIGPGKALWKYISDAGGHQTVLATIKGKGEWTTSPPGITPDLLLTTGNVNTWEIEWEPLGNDGGGSATVHAEELTMCPPETTSREDCL